MVDEGRITSTIEAALPAVVSIVLTKHAKQIAQQHTPHVYPFYPAHKPAHATTPQNPHTPMGGGSGFVVDTSGLIITNKHVISEPDVDYTAITSDGRHLPATVVSRDPITDVAVLSVSARNLPALTLGDATTVRLGSFVIAIGNALGMFSNTVSLGIVSGLSRSVTAQLSSGKGATQELRGLIQTDAAINPGNSGGPLITLDGKVIGINAALIAGAQNISLAIPINAATRDLADIKQYGRIRRPYLGVRYVILDETSAAAVGIPATYGAFVTNETPHDTGVVPDSPAAKAGIQERDVILTCNGKHLTLEYTFQDVLDTAAIGDQLQLAVLRNGGVFRATVQLEERTA